MKHYTEIDNKIQRGYLCMLENQTAKGCDVWLDAWENIKTLIKKTGAKDIFELDKKYFWTGSISNYVQDMETELHNAGALDVKYHQKGIKYCRELLGYCGKDARIISNTRRAIGEAYSQLQRSAPKKSPDYRQMSIVSSDKTGRNDPCPCGSGKKYKKCCGV